MSNAGDRKIDSATARDVCFKAGGEDFTYLGLCISLALMKDVVW